MRRAAISLAVLIVIGLHLTASPVVDSTVPRVVRNRPPLQPGAFAPAAARRSSPTAGCGASCEIQAEGLTGHLDEFWPDVGRTERLARRHRRKLGARAVLRRRPRAARLPAPGRALIAKAQPLGRVDADAPEPRRRHRSAEEHRLVAEHGDAEGAHAVSGGHRRSPRRARAARGTSHYHLAKPAASVRCTTGPSIAGPTSSSASSGSTTAPAIRALLDLARTLHDQGTDWRRHFADFEFTAKTTNAAARREAEPKRLPGPRDARARRQQRDGAEDVARSGRSSPATPPIATPFIARAGRARSLPRAAERHVQRRRALRRAAIRREGTELCAVVEALFSLQQASPRDGGVALADRLERIAFNALPATFSADMWSHQYDQQPTRCCAA